MLGGVMSDTGPHPTLEDRVALIERRVESLERSQTRTHLGPVTEVDLSPRLRECLRLMIGEGLSVKEMGGRLGVSPKTIENHLTRLYTVLGVTSRTQLFAWAHEHPDAWKPDNTQGSDSDA